MTLEVQYIKVLDMDTTYWRYLPFLKELSEDESTRHQQMIEWDSELDFYKNKYALKEVINENHWDNLLSHYVITEQVVNSHDSDIAMWVFRKRPHSEVNAPLYIIRVICAEIDIVLSEETKYLKSHPVPGRLNEYIILEGDVEFNIGDFNTKHWVKRTAISEDVQLKGFERKYKKLKQVEAVETGKFFTVFQMRNDESEMFIVDANEEEDFKKWLSRVDQYESSKSVERGIYRHYNNKLYYGLGVAVNLDTFEEFVIYQALYGEMKFFSRSIEEFNEELDKSIYENITQTRRFELVSK